MSENINNSEINAIKDAIMKFYHEGHVKANPALYEKILYDGWKFFLHDENGNLRIVDKNEYYSWYDPENVNKDLIWKTQFEYVDVTDKIGSAKIIIGNQNVEYTDYFNLMKLEGKWWIVHKISVSNRTV
ncbi:MAG: nuclear transport factor 2 family protein [Promethearchaeota archaeon]